MSDCIKRLTLLFNGWNAIILIKGTQQNRKQKKPTNEKLTQKVARAR